jgi:beta-lactamase class D
MKRYVLAALGLAFGCVSPAKAETRTVCTIATEADGGRVLVEEGDCAGRMPPASTFKIAIALMGLDAGVLISPNEPELPFRDGYVDWRPEWKQATTPARWMKYSVVWYSQQVNLKLGMERYRHYVEAFGYGNADVSGDPGKDNGLTRAWLSSSLAISPREQVAFLRRMISGELPVSEAAVVNTAAITDYGMMGDGWRVHGKTGAGLPKDANGKLLRGKPFGWFVGWAEKDGRQVVFARLIRDSERQDVSPGFRARDGVVEDLFGADCAIR